MSLFHSPIITYQRHRERIEEALVAAFLATVVGLFLDTLAIFPSQWKIVLLLVIFALGAQSRAWGYYAAVATLIWPLWQLSPYLLTLFLAVALLPRDWIIDALPWALLVVSAPLLAQWQVLGLPPLLAGLLVGSGTAWWVGLFTALWLKLVGGLAGWVPELGAMHGAPLTIELIQPQVAEANSLETLLLLASPFAGSPFQLLLHLLQVLLWGLGGWMVGKVRELEWKDREPRLIFAPALAAGTLLLWSAIFLVPAWLDLQPLGAFLAQPTPTVGLALAALTTALLTTIYEGAQRPVAARRPRQPRPRVRMGREGLQRAAESPVSRRRGQSEGRQPEEDDVIMLELD